MLLDSVGDSASGSTYVSSSLTCIILCLCLLAFGAIAATLLILTYKSPRMELESLAFKEKMRRLDFIGATLLIGCIVCLLLALQWGGSMYPWSDSKVWGCLLGFGLLLVAFVLSQAIDQAKYVFAIRRNYAKHALEQLSRIG
jgi:hypothetical protein